MRADRALVSAFCLQKQKPVSLLELCSASALYSFFKRVIWILSWFYTMLTFLCERKKKTLETCCHTTMSALWFLLDLLIWPFKVYQQNDFFQSWTNLQIKATTTKRTSPGGVDRATLALPSLLILFLHQEDRILPSSLSWIFPSLPPTPHPHGCLLLLQISAHWSLLPKSLAWSEHFIQWFPCPASSACFLHNYLSKVSGDRGKKNPNCSKSCT